MNTFHKVTNWLKNVYEKWYERSPYLLIVGLLLWVCIITALLITIVG